MPAKRKRKPKPVKAGGPGNAQGGQKPAVHVTVAVFGVFMVQLVFDGPVIINGVIDMHIQPDAIGFAELKAAWWKQQDDVTYQAGYRNPLSGRKFKIYANPQHLSTKQGGGLVSVSGILM